MKVCIDAGHGGRDPGATFNGLLEKTVVITIAGMLNKMLRLEGVETCMTRAGDEYLGLRQRVTIANESAADYFVSIHTNADPDEDEPGMPEADGQEIFYLSDAGMELASAIGDSLQAEFPEEPWRGLKKRGLYVVRKTSMPAVLVEVAFIDNSESNLELRTPEVRRHLARAICQGILGLKETQYV